MIKTIRLKNLIKYLVGLIVVILITIGSTRFFSGLNNNDKLSYLNINFTNIFKSTIRIANYDIISISKENQRYSSRSGVERILETELPNIKEKQEEVEEKDLQEDTNKADNEEQEVQREEVELKEAYTNSYGSVKIKNDTDIKLTEDILIYHTHTCESYTATKENTYKASGNFRTTNLNYSVVKVGKELEKRLDKLDFNVLRNETKHDYPAYSGSYERSLETIKDMLKNNSDAEIVFDIHRDAIGSNSNYAPTVEINGEKVAQLMFVIGTNDGGRKTSKLEEKFEVCSYGTRKS